MHVLNDCLDVKIQNTPVLCINNSNNYIRACNVGN